MRCGAFAIGQFEAVLSGAIVLAAVLFAASPARAFCDQSGSTVSCTGTTNAYDAGTQSGITVTVQPGATVNGSGGTDAIKITNPSFIVGDTLINNGTINGFVTILSSAAGIDQFTNNGILKVTDPTSLLQSYSLAGSTFVQTASGTFIARVDAGGFNDNILANATTLAGRLAIAVQPGLYTAPITYTFINSSTPIVGAFDTVTASSPFFGLTVSNCTCTVDVTLTPIAFNAVSGLTSNQQRVADVLRNLYASGTPTGGLTTFYSNLFAASSASVFDQLSGASTAAAQNASFGASGLFNDALNQQGLAWLESTPNAGAPEPLPMRYAQSEKPHVATDAFAALQTRDTHRPKEWRAWALGFGSTRSITGQPGFADQSMQTGGGAIGFERAFGNDLLIGIGAGGSASHFSVSSLSTSGNIDGGHFGIYAVKRWEAFYAAASFTYARFDNSIDRTIAGVGSPENAHGRFASNQFGGRLELGLQRELGPHRVTPFAAIEPAALWQNAYAESSTTVAGGAGVLGLSYGAHETTSLPTFLGAQIDTNYLLPNRQTLRPFLRAAWVHEFLPERQIVASFVSIPAAAFTVDGARPSRDSARIGAGTTWMLDDSKALFVKVNGEYFGNGRTIVGMAGAKLNW